MSCTLCVLSFHAFLTDTYLLLLYLLFLNFYYNNKYSIKKIIYPQNFLSGEKFSFLSASSLPSLYSRGGGGGGSLGVSDSLFDTTLHSSASKASSGAGPRLHAVRLWVNQTTWIHESGCHVGFDHRMNTGMFWAGETEDLQCCWFLKAPPRNMKFRFFCKKHERNRKLSSLSFR